MKVWLCLLLVLAALYSSATARADHSANTAGNVSGTADSLWVIVVNSTLNPADARHIAYAFQALVRPQALHTTIYAVEVEGQRRYRVTIGSFANLELASQARQRMSILPGDAWIWKISSDAVCLEAIPAVEGCETPVTDRGDWAEERIEMGTHEPIGEVIAEERIGVNPEPILPSPPAKLPPPARAGSLDRAAEPPQDDRLRIPEAKRLRVYLDCESKLCDFDFFRREIKFVDYVRDRVDSDVHVLVAAQPTGSGGTEFTLEFVGRYEFAGLHDTLSYTAPQNDTAAEIRGGLAHVLKIGLVRYLSRTAQRDWLQIAYAAPETKPADRGPGRDRWNSWVFKIFAGGSANGEQQFRSYQGYVTPSASHITERWKIELGGKGTRYVQFFEYNGTTYEDILESYSGDALVVRSLGRRCSAGLRSSVLHSTFANQDLTLRLAPAVEFNVFPYSESSRKRFTFLYEFGLTSFDYLEETLFGKTSEIFPRQVLTVTLDLKQPWGSVGLGIAGNHFLPGHYSVDSDAYVSLRLFRGFSLDVTGGVSSIRDQIHLPKGGATPEETLLRRKELATDYRYFVTLGFGYTFGSIYNNVVNPRFGR